GRLRRLDLELGRLQTLARVGGTRARHGRDLGVLDLGRQLYRRPGEDLLGAGRELHLADGARLPGERLGDRACEGAGAAVLRVRRGAGGTGVGGCGKDLRGPAIRVADQEWRRRGDVDATLLAAGRLALVRLDVEGGDPRSVALRDERLALE